jgi:hypothetical protein
MQNIHVTFINNTMKNYNYYIKTTIIQNYSYIKLDLILSFDILIVTNGSDVMKNSRSGSNDRKLFVRSPCIFFGKWNTVTPGMFTLFVY